MKHGQWRLSFAGLFLGLAVPACAARADGHQFDPPAPAAFFFTNGKQLLGRVVSLDAERVVCQVDVGINIYRASRLQVIETDDRTFTFDAQKQGWDSARTQMPTPLLEKAKATLQESSRTRNGNRAATTETAISEGVGKTTEDALKDAFRNAVRQVVGAVVDAETLVKNDQIITDQVLAYSDGLIQTYKELSSQEEAGLFRKRIAAQVVRRSVSARLGESLTAKPVEGPDLAAAVLTQQEARENAAALLHKALAELPKALVATARPTTAADYDEDTRLLRVDVAVQADPGRYAAFLQRLLPLLDQIRLNKGSVLLTARPGLGFHLNPEGGVEFLSPAGCALTGPDVNQVAKGWCVWVLTRLDGQGCQARWDGYLLDSDIRQSMSSLLGKLRVHLTLLDREGGILTEEDIPLDDVKDRRVLWAGIQRVVSERNNESRRSLNLLIAPLFFSTGERFLFQGKFTYAYGVTMHRKIKLTLPELQRLLEISCEVRFRKE
jgi:hypothetical protein